MVIYYIEKLEIETMMGNYIKIVFSSILTSITTRVINKFEIDFVNTNILLLAYLLLLWLVSLAIILCSH